jgi:hypothetical protein
MQLSKHIGLTSVGFTTGASSVVEVDCKDAEGCLFIGVPASTAARTWSLALKSGNTTATFIACNAINTLSSSTALNDVLIVDVANPGKRYLGATFSSTVATPCYLLAMPYRQRILPTAWSAAANVPVSAGGYLAVTAPSSTT